MKRKESILMLKKLIGLLILLIIASLSSCSFSKNITGNSKNVNYFNPQSRKDIDELNKEFNGIGKSSNYKITKVFSHPGVGFTEGLEYLGKNEMIESIGGYNKSKIIEYNINSGRVTSSQNNAKDEFGEGVTVLDNRIIQLTWENNIINTYNKNGLKPLSKHVFFGTGWGVCNDGSHLYVSDGTTSIKETNSNNFKIMKKINVILPNGFSVHNINELDCSKSSPMITANMFKSNLLIQFNKMTGKIFKIYDLSKVFAIEQASMGRNFTNEEVLNGVSFDSNDGDYFVTGKNWNHIYKIKLQ